MECACVSGGIARRLQFSDVTCSFNSEASVKLQKFSIINYSCDMHSYADIDCLSSIITVVCRGISRTDTK